MIDVNQQPGMANRQARGDPEGMNSLGHFHLIHKDGVVRGEKNCLENARIGLVGVVFNVLASVGSTEWAPHLQLYNLAEVWH